jgi:hypothetical protein
MSERRRGHDLRESPFRTSTNEATNDYAYATGSVFQDDVPALRGSRIAPNPAAAATDAAAIIMIQEPAMNMHRNRVYLKFVVPGLARRSAEHARRNGA